MAGTVAWARGLRAVLGLVSAAAAGGLAAGAAAPWLTRDGRLVAAGVLLGGVLADLLLAAVRAAEAEEQRRVQAGVRAGKVVLLEGLEKTRRRRRAHR